MYSEIVNFPKLGIDFKIERIAFTVGGMPIYWYGVIIGLGLVLGVLLSYYNAKKVGVNRDRLIDVLIGAIIGGVIGARIYYVVFSWDEYKYDLKQIFAIRNGGLAIYGALILGVAALVLMCRIRKVKLLPALDACAPGILLGQAIGRWGNFVNAEAYGTNTNSIFGMTSLSIKKYLESLVKQGVEGIDPSVPVHPTFFYESIWCFIGVLLLMFVVMKHRKFDGQVFLSYIIWYSFERAFVEGLRTDSLYLGSFRISQVLSVILFVFGILLLYVICKKRKAMGENVAPLYVNTEEGQAAVSGKLYEKKSQMEPETKLTEESVEDSAAELQNVEESAHNASGEDDQCSEDDSTVVPENESETESEQNEATGSADDHDNQNND